MVWACVYVVRVYKLSLIVLSKNVLSLYSQFVLSLFCDVLTNP